MTNTSRWMNSNFGKMYSTFFRRIGVCFDNLWKRLSGRDICRYGAIIK